MGREEALRESGGRQVAVRVLNASEQVSVPPQDDAMHAWAVTHAGGPSAT